MKKITKDQWMVLLGAALFQLAMGGMLQNCVGVVLAQIKTQYAVSATRIAAFNTTRAVAGMATSAVMASLFFKMKKPVYMMMNILLIAAGFTMAVIFPLNAGFYAAAVVLGSTSAANFVIIPFLMNSWFPENGGTTAGIAFAASGVGGAVFNPLCAKLINLVGLTEAVVILSIAMIAVTVPSLLMIFCRPQPEADTRKADAPAEKAPAFSEIRGRFISVWFCIVGITLSYTMVNNVSLFAQTEGYSLTVGAAMTTIVMIGNIIGKFIYGWLVDKLTVWRAVPVFLAAVAASMVLFIFCPGSLAVMYIASFLLGMVYALSMLTVSRASIAAYGVAGAKKYTGWHTTVNSALSAAFAYAVGPVVDSTGSYKIILAICLVSCFFSSAAALHMGRKLNASK